MWYNYHCFSRCPIDIGGLSFMEIQLWREILTPYELAVEELSVKFRHLVREHREQGLYSPIEQVKGRVKSVTSILEKAQKKILKSRILKNILRILRVFALSANL